MEGLAKFAVTNSKVLTASYSELDNEPVMQNLLHTLNVMSLLVNSNLYFNHTFDFN